MNRESRRAASLILCVLLCSVSVCCASASAGRSAGPRETEVFASPYYAGTESSVPEGRAGETAEGLAKPGQVSK